MARTKQNRQKPNTDETELDLKKSTVEEKQEDTTTEVTPIVEEQVKEQQVDTPVKVTPKKEEQVKEKVSKQVFGINSLVSLADVQFLEKKDGYKQVIDFVTEFTNKGKKIPADKYSFYLNILTLINNEDYNKFKDGFALLHRLFLIEKDNKLEVLNLLSEDYLWTFGSKSKTGYNILIEMLSQLANVRESHQKLKQVNVKNFFKYLNNTGIRNLTKFYNL